MYETLAVHFLVTTFLCLACPPGTRVMILTFIVVAEESQLLLLKCNSPLSQVVLTHGKELDLTYYANTNLSL